jgi:hypothetical protein
LKLLPTVVAVGAGLRLKIFRSLSRPCMAARALPPLPAAMVLLPICYIVGTI